MAAGAGVKIPSLTTYLPRVTSILLTMSLGMQSSVKFVKKPSGRDDNVISSISESGYRRACPIRRIGQTRTIFTPP